MPLARIELTSLRSQHNVLTTVRQRPTHDNNFKYKPLILSTDIIGLQNVPGVGS